MRQLQLFVLLLQPSVFSFAVAALASGALLAVGNWSGIANSRLLYDYLSIGNILGTTPEGFTTFLDALLGGRAAYLFVTLALAATVSLLVYLFLDSIENMVNGFLTSNVRVRSLSERGQQRILAEMITHIIFRAAAFLAWGMYTALFVMVIVPYLVYVFGSATADLSHMQWREALPAWILAWLALHVHVIFLRLFLLRPRVFGGEDVVAAGLE